MKLKKPIVFFDIETTGLELANDRIIEIAMIKQFPNDEDDEVFNQRINPEGRDIHPEAFGKHGIKVEDLVGCPTFCQSAQEIYDFIKDCDLGGYNCKRFDIPILIEEFLRAKIPVSIQSFKIIDVYRILLKAEPRTLEGTYKRFLGKELEGAHGAKADIIGTIDILKEMEKTFSIPDTVDEIHKYTFEEDRFLDLENKLKRTKEGSIIFAFGKHKNLTVQQVHIIDPSYFRWIINKSDMTLSTKSIFRNIFEVLNKPKSS